MRTLAIFIVSTLLSQAYAQDKNIVILEPARVFDGFEMHENWNIAYQDGIIIYAGSKSETPKELAAINPIILKEITLMPGMIEGHSHMLLHPYNETSWNDQVLKESPESRAIRAVNHARETLNAGITTSRDLGSEGAGYADVALKNSISQGIIPGPELIVAGPAIVATGSYGPKGFHPGVNVPLGAQEADGLEGVTRVTREQIGNGADFIKVYADYRWGPDGSARPTFSVEELKAIVSTAQSSGRYVVAHASTEEGMRRAILAGVRTIEHGDQGTKEIFLNMKERNIGYCPTLGAVEAISRYSGYDPETDPEPERIRSKKESFRLALESGVKIVFGGDVGVFTHGKNAWEIELMVQYGMSPMAALKSATSGNAEMFQLSDRGILRKGFRADIIGIAGNPVENVKLLIDPVLVIKSGEVVKQLPGEEEIRAKN